MTGAKPEASGARRLLVATVVSGGLGYLTLAFATHQLSAGSYAAFATFWSGLYLVVGSVNGVQQEVSRSSTSALRTPVERGPHTALRLFLAVAVALAALGVIGAPWAHDLFGSHTSVKMVVLVAGAVAYSALAVSVGLLYAAESWRLVAWAIIADGALRIALVGAALALGLSDILVALCVVAPFLIVHLVVLQRRGWTLWGEAVFDAHGSRLLRNTASAVLAGAGIAALVSGLPLILAWGIPEVDDAVLAPIIVAITLVRAPLVIPTLALQGFLVVRYVNLGRRASADATRTIAVVAVAVALATVGAATVGAGLVASVFGADYQIDAGLLAWIVASSGAVATLTITGALALARSLHRTYSAGWLVAAASTVVLVMTRVEFHHRVVLALAVPPTIGVAVHVAGLVAARRAEDRAGFGRPTRERS